MKTILLIVSLYATSALPLNVDTGSLTIEIPEIKKQEGPITIALFSNDEGFPSDPLKADFSIKIEDYGTSLTHTFENVPFGSYAAMIMQDRNDNGKVDRRRIPPIPKEPIGMSNMTKMARPKFDKSTFEFKEDGMVLTVPFINQ
ncbi:MAG: DUF2141 domain-containing protein [Bacteroidota bacterium]